MVFVLAFWCVERGTAFVFTDMWWGGRGDGDGVDGVEWEGEGCLCKANV
jgi:hypothetical protein